MSNVSLLAVASNKKVVRDFIRETTEKLNKYKNLYVCAPAVKLLSGVLFLGDVEEVCRTKWWWSLDFSIDITANGTTIISFADWSIIDKANDETNSILAKITYTYKVEIIQPIEDLEPLTKRIADFYAYIKNQNELGARSETSEILGVIFDFFVKDGYILTDLSLPAALSKIPIVLTMRRHDVTAIVEIDYQNYLGHSVENVCFENGVYVGPW